MKNRDLERLDVELVEPTNSVRHGLRGGLLRMGFERIRDFRSLEDLMNEGAESMPDLLVCNADSGDEEAFDNIRAIRFRQHGENPFLPIICFTNEPSEERVKSAVNSGADHLLIAPIAPAQIVKRVEHLLAADRNFVVTAEYIGPDRRKGRVDEPSKVPLIQVPNILRARAEGLDETDIRRAIAVTAAVFDEEKVLRNAHYISYLVEEAVPKCLDDDNVAALGAVLRKVGDLGQDLESRLDLDKYGHVLELCRTLLEICERVVDADTIGRRDVEVLKPLAQAIRASVSPDETAAAAMAKEIIVTLGGDVERAS